MRQTRMIKPMAPRGDGARDYVQSLKSQYPGAIITQSYLRSEVQIGATATSQYSFNILANQGTPGAVERRLQITDRFAVTAVAMMIYAAPTASLGAASTDADRATAKLYTWNSPTGFGTAAIAKTLEPIYQGFLRMVIDGTVYIDSLDSRRFYQVPNSQSGTAVASAAAAVANVASAGTPIASGFSNTIQADGWDGSNYAFAQMTPSIVLNGAGRNEVSLNLPVASGASQSTYNFYISLYMRGWLIQNSSQLNR